MQNRLYNKDAHARSNAPLLTFRRKLHDRFARVSFCNRFILNIKFLREFPVKSEKLRGGLL